MAAATLIASFTLPCPYPYRLSASPNAEWLAGYCWSTTLVVSRTDGAAQWVLEYDSSYGRAHDSAEGSLTPFHWSPDGRFLFIDVSAQADGSYILFGHPGTLLRLTLATGAFVPLFNSGFYSYSISPDGNLLAILEQGRTPLSLRMVDLRSYEARTLILSEEYDSGGDFLWLPGTNSLLLAADLSGPELDALALFLVDSDLMSAQLLVKDDPRLLVPYEWLSEDIVLLKELDEDAFWELDLQTGEISQPGR